MNGIRHPFTGALHEQDGDGRVRVTKLDRASGREISGLFEPNGRWVSGELEEADPQLCGWVAGPIFGNHRLSASQGT